MKVIIRRNCGDDWRNGIKSLGSIDVDRQIHRNIGTAGRDNNNNNNRR